MEELLKDLQGLKSATEIIDFAKARKVDLDPAKAQEIYCALQENKLGDDMLEAISGGKQNCSTEMQGDHEPTSFEA